MTIYKILLTTFRCCWGTASAGGGQSEQTEADAGQNQEGVVRCQKSGKWFSP